MGIASILKRKPIVNKFYAVNVIVNVTLRNVPFRTELNVNMPNLDEMCFYICFSKIMGFFFIASIESIRLFRLKPKIFDCCVFQPFDFFGLGQNFLIVYNHNNRIFLIFISILLSLLSKCILLICKKSQ